jgi:hypothetical protein
VRDYSKTPLPKKLGIKEGSRVAVIGGPQDFLGEIPRTRARSARNVVIFFTTKRAELERRFPPLTRSLAPDGGLWVAWPKKAAAVETDLTFDSVQTVGLKHGLVDNKSCSIDETWQALRFVYRVESRRR